MTRYPPRKPSPRAVRDLHETYARTATPSAGRQAAADAARDGAFDDAAAFVDGMSSEFRKLYAEGVIPEDDFDLPSTVALFTRIAAGIRAMRSEGGR